MSGSSRISGFLVGSVLALVTVGCGSEGEPTLVPSSAPAAAEATEAAAPTGPLPTAVLPDGARLFGTALTDRAATPLAEISASPDAYADQIVRTSGTIERVCQAMGCWMELRAEGVEPVRVPMAGHSFFLPRDVAGHPAEIEGRVALRTLSPEARAHLEGEGAMATAGALSIDATGVVVR
jgi:hypothetical protein